MTSSDAPAFRTLMLRLGVVYDKPASDAKATVYYDELKDIPIGLLQEAVALHVKRARTYPRPAELRTLADEAQAIDVPQKALPPRTYADGDEPAPPTCGECSDTGWRIVTMRAPVYGPDATVEGVRRCGCWHANPKAQPSKKRYGHQDSDFHRSW